MEVRKDEFPVVVQAYETTGQQEVFVAEQVVNTQLEIDHFTNRYAGKLIKARALRDGEYKNHPTHANETRRKSSGTAVMMIILLLIVALVAIGFATGWIQRTFNIEM